jgi:hypothetical protein
MVGDKCDGINQILVKISETFDIDGEGKCFDVVAGLDPPCWTMFFAAAGLIAIGLPSLTIFDQALHDRTEAALGRNHGHHDYGNSVLRKLSRSDSQGIIRTDPEAPLTPNSAAEAGVNIVNNFTVDGVQPLLVKDSSGNDVVEASSNDEIVTLSQHATTFGFNILLYTGMLESVHVASPLENYPTSDDKSLLIPFSGSLRLAGENNEIADNLASSSSSSSSSAMSSGTTVHNPLVTEPVQD